MKIFWFSLQFFCEVHIFAPILFLEYVQFRKFIVNRNFGKCFILNKIYFSTFGKLTLSHILNRNLCLKNILLILSPIFSVLFWMHFYLVKRPSERWRRKVSKFVPLLKLLNISTFVRLNRQHKETSCKTGLLTFSSSFFRVKVSKHFQFLFSFASVICFL